MGFAQGAGRHLRQTNGLDLALAHQVAQCAHTVFDRHFFVPTVQVIQVDHIGLEAAKCVFAGLFDGFGAAVDDAHFAAVALFHALHAAFAGQREAVAVRLHHLAHQRLVGAKAIQRGGVEKRHTLVQGSEQNPLALLGRDRCAISMAEVHAAQADGADVKGGDLAVFHAPILTRDKPRTTCRSAWASKSPSSWSPCSFRPNALAPACPNRWRENL